MEEKSWLIFWQGMAMIAVPALAAGGRKGPGWGAVGGGAGT